MRQTDRRVKVGRAKSYLKPEWGGQAEDRLVYMGERQSAARWMVIAVTCA